MSLALYADGSFYSREIKYGRFRLFYLGNNIVLFKKGNYTLYHDLSVNYDQITPEYQQIYNQIINYITSHADLFRGPRGAKGDDPDYDLIKTTMAEWFIDNSYLFQGPPGADPDYDYIRDIMADWFKTNKALFKGDTGANGVNADNNWILKNLKTWISDNISQFQGATGASGSDGEDGDDGGVGGLGNSIWNGINSILAGAGIVAGMSAHSRITDLEDATNLADTAMDTIGDMFDDLNEMSEDGTQQQKPTSYKEAIESIIKILKGIFSDLYGTFGHDSAVAVDGEQLQNLAQGNRRDGIIVKSYTTTTTPSPYANQPPTITKNKFFQIDATNTVFCHFFDPTIADPNKRYYLEYLLALNKDNQKPCKFKGIAYHWNQGDGVAPTLPTSVHLLPYETFVFLHMRLNITQDSTDFFDPLTNAPLIYTSPFIRPYEKTYINYIRIFHTDARNDPTKNDERIMNRTICSYEFIDKNFMRKYLFDENFNAHVAYPYDIIKPDGTTKQVNQIELANIDGVVVYKGKNCVSWGGKPMDFYNAYVPTVGYYIGQGFPMLLKEMDGSLIGGTGEYFFREVVGFTTLGLKLNTQLVSVAYVEMKTNALSHGINDLKQTTKHYFTVYNKDLVTKEPHNHIFDKVLIDKDDIGAQGAYLITLSYLRHMQKLNGQPVNRSEIDDINRRIQALITSTQKNSSKIDKHKTAIQQLGQKLIDTTSPLQDLPGQIFQILQDKQKIENDIQYFKNQRFIEIDKKILQIEHNHTDLDNRHKNSRAQVETIQATMNGMMEQFDKQSASTKITVDGFDRTCNELRKKVEFLDSYQTDRNAQFQQTIDTLSNFRDTFHKDSQKFLTDIKANEL
jgi:transcription antitermination factor NusG